MARLDDCHREFSHNSRNWLIARDYSSAKATLETERVFAASAAGIFGRRVGGVESLTQEICWVVLE